MAGSLGLTGSAARMTEHSLRRFGEVIDIPPPAPPVLDILVNGTGDVMVNENGDILVLRST